MASNNETSSSSLPSKMQSLNLNTPPWLDLPNPLTENILKRLPFSKYIRFGAVCPNWLSIQTAHHRLHAPMSPPMINLPWFISDRPEQDSVLCLRPFEQRTHRHRVPLTPRYLEYQRESSRKTDKIRSFSFPNGWLLLDDLPYQPPSNFIFTFMNPVSGAQIETHEISEGSCSDCKAAVSAPSGGGFSVLLLTTDKWGKRFELFRHGPDHGYWDEVEFPDSKMGWDGVPVSVISSIFWGGKFYCIYLSRGLIVIDPLPDEPTIQFLEMDQSQLPVLGNIWEDDMEDRMELFLVESNGKLLLVVEFFEFDPTHATRGLAGFQVFEADFSESPMSLQQGHPNPTPLDRHSNL